MQISLYDITCIPDDVTVLSHLVAFLWLLRPYKFNESSICSHESPWSMEKIVLTVSICLCCAATFAVFAQMECPDTPIYCNNYKSLQKGMVACPLIYYRCAACSTDNIYIYIFYVAMPCKACMHA